MSHCQVQGVVRKAQMGHRVPRIPRSAHFGQVAAPQQLDVSVGKTDGEEVPVRGEGQHLGHQLVEELHQMKGS
eukprot:CAMPEP_0204498978 /NCGR_PEP_ID=MMETSP0471-20130131/94102_1 /ASSEMBLY_ACC=CAM_ASM_000602 /TAXON_ID=2969 /ORGANISM="Oxyrrhis marina" /LENGTH=72 /DNA_ID=CAMNT_0051503485 /DNA_START=19 /DNA_END=233 /DNA_ORIENTATION=-